MNLDEREGDVLTRARRALSPSAVSTARVRESLERAFIARTSSDAPPAVPRTPAAHGPTLRLLAGIAIGAIGGFALGYSTGVTNAPEREPLQEAAPAPEAPRQPLAEEPKSVEPATPSLARESAPPRQEPTPPPRLSAGEPGLAEETRMVARIERALRERNPRLALGLLGELDRTIPSGQLLEERAAVRAMGYCELDPKAGEAQAREFEKRYPASAYQRRVADTCRRVENAPERMENAEPGDSP